MSTRMFDAHVPNKCKEKMKLKFPLVGKNGTHGMGIVREIMQFTDVRYLKHVLCNYNGFDVDVSR